MTTIARPPLPRTQHPREVAAFRRQLRDHMDTLLVERVQTTSSGNTPILTVALELFTNVLFEFWIVARQTGGSGGTVDDGAAWSGFVVYKMVGAVATKVGSESIAFQGADNANVAIGLTQSNNQVQWVVNGDVNADYTWVIELRSLTVSL